jgi:N-acylneuraminate cytidylyltransferase
LAGKPLIVWTIEAAQRAATLDRIVVSTDDDEIAAVAEAAGAQVYRRPSELAGDTTPTEPVLLHVLDALAAESYKPDAVALLQCTSPLRGADIIDRCVRLLAHSGCDAVMTVTPIQHWYLCGRVDQDGVFQPEYDYARRPFSQQMPEKFRENGACYVTRTSCLRTHRNRLGGQVRVVPMDVIRSIDIDTEADFLLAEEAIRGVRVL